MENREPKQMTDSLRREIKIYNILTTTYVRGGGSLHESHPQRCLWEICGKSMLQRALEVPLASKYVNKVVLTSEDQKILRIGEGIKGVTIVPRPLDTVYEVPRDWNAGVFQTGRPRSLLSGEPFTGGLKEGIIKTGQRNERYYLIWYLKEQESYATDIEIIVPANEPMATPEILDRLIETFFQDKEANYGHTFVPVAPYIFFINPITKRPFPFFFSSGLDKQYYPFGLLRQGPFQLWGKPKENTYNDERKIAYIIISEEEGLDIHNKKDLAYANYIMEKRLEKEKKEEINKEK